jgi:branched-chain amino acid transport system permease protein
MAKLNWPKRRVYLLAIGFLVLLISMGLFVKSSYVLHILISICIFSIAALGVRLVMLTGHWNFGQGAFLTLGAYSSALLVTRLGFSFWYALPLCALIVAAVGAGIGYVTLRVKGLYFALITITLGQIVRELIIRIPSVTGAFNGIPGLPPPNPIQIFGQSLEFGSHLSFYYLISLLLLVTLLVMYRVDKSRLGALFKAIMQNDTLCESVGINVLRYKVMAFTVACFFAGLAGSFSAHYYHMVHPDFFDLWSSIYVVAYACVGGVGSVLGPIVGSSTLIVAVELFRSTKAFQAVVYAALMIVVILFLPGGIISLGPLISARIGVLHNLVNKVLARR